MHTKRRFHNAFFGVTLRPDSAAFAIMVLLLILLFVFLFLTLTAQPAQGQTFRVIYNFTNEQDGAEPFSGVMIDPKGDLYGTTEVGGDGYGTVFKMTLQGPDWILTPIYAFNWASDGAYPTGGVISDASGALYGTTIRGGTSQWGTVFKLTPPVTGGAQWTESVLHNFTNGSDGGSPFSGVVFDEAGNIYGTTYFGGSHDPENCGDLGCGTVFKLTSSGPGWAETVLHTFLGGSDGSDVFAGVVFDRAGHLYGTATESDAASCSSWPRLVQAGSRLFCINLGGTEEDVSLPAA